MLYRSMMVAALFFGLFTANASAQRCSLSGVCGVGGLQSVGFGIHQGFGFHRDFGRFGVAAVPFNVRHGFRRRIGFVGRGFGRCGRF